MRCRLPDAGVERCDGPTAACVNGIARTMPRGEMALSICYSFRILDTRQIFGTGCLIDMREKCIPEWQTGQNLCRSPRLAKFAAGMLAQTALWATREQVLHSTRAFAFG